eukprot:1158797-Pelagomonas_calceolata.AAC.14
MPDLGGESFLKSPSGARKKEIERIHLPSPAACIKERSPVLKGRAPPHRSRGRASTEVYSSKLAPTMGPTTRMSGRPCPAGASKHSKRTGQHEHEASE